MRCSRCDRLAVPQAVGTSSEGIVVFGWCLSCLEETGCDEIMVSERVEINQRPSIRLDLDAGRYRPKAMLVSEADAVKEMIRDRLKIMGAVALVLALWGLAIGSMGLGMLARTPMLTHTPPSPFGNGTPALLIGGGCTTAAVGLTLWAWTAGRCWFISPEWLRRMRLGALTVACLILAAGVIKHSSRRDPIIILAASIALGVSVAAHWLELRQATRCRSQAMPIHD